MIKKREIQKLLMNKEFDIHWSTHKKRLMGASPFHEEWNESKRMSTAGDWLLMAFPVIVFVAFVSSGLIKHELLNYVLGGVLCGIALVVSEFIKPYVTGKRSIGDIEKDAKEFYFKKYQETGRLP